MNIVKKIAIAATFLCAATAANAEDGMKIGARVGYSLQKVGAADMGTLGIGAGVVANIPAGPVVIGPEVAFLYRENYTDQTEMAISVPVLVKWFPIEGLYIQAGAQFDLPLGAKQGDLDMDGKETETDFFGVKIKSYNPERATFDLGIPVGIGYFVMPNLSVDARYVIGLMAHSKYKVDLFGITSEIETDPLSIISIGATYFF